MVNIVDNSTFENERVMKELLVEEKVKKENFEKLFFLLFEKGMSGIVVEPYAKISFSVLQKLIDCGLLFYSKKKDLPLITEMSVYGKNDVVSYNFNHQNLVSIAIRYKLIIFLFLFFIIIFIILLFYYFIFIFIFI